MSRVELGQLLLPLLDGTPPVHRACQRWRHGRATYRVPDEVIVPSHYEVAAIDDDATAKAFVLAHHYSSSFPSARFRIGLYRRGALVGIAVFSHPVQDRVLTRVFGPPATAAVELGRLTLLDSEKSNAETFFLGRAFDILRREGIRGVLSFSDPVPRTTADGTIIFPGHVGTCLQAHNATYLGRATPRTLRVLPNGTVLSDRAIVKIRSEEKGWRYASAILERHGAEHPSGDLSVWLDRWLPRLTRPLRHAGNHRYAWALHRSYRRFLVGGRPYPKQLERSIA